MVFSDGGGTDDDHGNQSDGDCGGTVITLNYTTNSFLDQGGRRPSNIREGD